MDISPDDAYGTRRSSPLLPGVALAHADLHNHTLLSDGAGDPADAFASMRRSGLDIAAITDHAELITGVARLLPAGVSRRVGGLDDAGWGQVAQLAEEADERGGFVAIRGFEWSHPVLGHVSVWGTERFTNPLATLGRSVVPLYEWLSRRDGGADGLTGFNHPGGRGTSRFSGFRFHPGAAERMVSLEMFNKTDDYLYQDTEKGQDSALVACLAAGWRPGLLGASDEHGDSWGEPEGKGRAGLFVRELSRAGVREALLARRSFATRVKGLRFAATLGGVPMGGSLRHRRGPVEVLVDVDLGSGSKGRPLSVQVLRPASGMPVLAAVVDVEVPGPDDGPVCFEVDLDVDDGDWAVVRLSDPARPADRRARGDYDRLGEALAYASPVWLDAG